MWRSNSLRDRRSARWPAIRAVLATALLPGCGDTRPPVNSEPPPPRCDVSRVLASDGAAEALATASAARAPTERELDVAALLWAQVVLAAEGEPLDPVFTEAPMDALLADLPAAYPSLFTSEVACTTAQALISGRGDFSCTNDCVPSPELLKNTGNELLERIVANLGARLKRLGKLSAYSTRARDRVAAFILAYRRKEQEYKVANQVWTRGKQALDVLDIIDATMSLEDSQALLIDVTDVIEDIAELAGGKTVAAAVLAFQIGYELGNIANLSLECAAWKSRNCSTPPPPDTLAGPFAASTPYTDEDCTWTLTLTARASLTNFGGAGTLADPYEGQFAFDGTLAARRTAGVADCTNGDVPVSDFVGTVGGTAGRVVILGTVRVFDRREGLDLLDGRWDGTSIRGRLRFAIHAFGVRLAVFEDEVVLRKP